MNATIQQMQAQVRAALAAMADGSVRLLWIDPAPWFPVIDALQALLSPGEMARIQRKRRLQDRALLTVAYAFHRLVLAEVLACNPATLRIERDALGCPCLPDDAWRTSLSHCEQAVAVALARHHPVGVDVEPARRAEGMYTLAEQICAAAERRVFAGMAVEVRDRFLLRLWVRKEAVLKALGVGLARPMSSFGIDERGRAIVDGYVNNILQLHDFECFDGLVIALATGPEAAVATARV